MLRLVASIAGGLLVAFLIVFGSDAVFHALVPAAAAMPTDSSDRTAMDAYVAGLPAAVLAGLALSWAVAALIGSWLAARFSVRGEWPGWVVGGLFLLSVLANFFLVTHPVWMIGLAVVAAIAATWVGARLGSRRN